MVDLVAPNGAVVSAREDAVKAMLDAGFAIARPAERPKPASRKRTAKTSSKG